MSKLRDTALIWSKLVDTYYNIDIGRKGVKRSLIIVFRKNDFAHLSGLHYANDIDFKLGRSQYSGPKMIDVILNGKLDSSVIEKSKNWSTIIKPRLDSIAEIENILDSEFEIYQFNPAKLDFYSRINAEFIIFDRQMRKGIFLFLDSDSGLYYFKSAFQNSESDYSVNQSRWTLLSTSKVNSLGSNIVYDRNK